MKPTRFVFSPIVTTAFLCLLSVTAFAIPSAEFTYVETPLAGGLWQYDYSLTNTSDPVADAGFDLFDLFFTFDPVATFTLLSLPGGWDSIAGSGFLSTFSTFPGIPPAGTDIAPGASLSGFVFQFNYQAGSLPFDVTLADPTGGDPVIYSGVSSAAATAVPEPATVVLLGAGLAGLAWVRKRARDRS